MQRFGQDSQAAGYYGEKDFEGHEHNCRADRCESRQALFVSCTFDRFGHSIRAISAGQATL